MNRQRLRIYEMVTRVNSFGERNGNLFPSDSDATELFKAVESDVKVLAELSNAAIAAETAVKSNLSAKAEAHAVLQNTLVRASKMCREFEIPHLALPAHFSAQVLITLGRGFVADAESVKSDFARHGLPIEEIDAAVRNLEAAVIGSSKAKAARAAAIQNWDATVNDAVARLHRLDLIAMNVLKENPIALGEYTTARVISKPAVRKEEETPAAKAVAIAA